MASIREYAKLLRHTPLHPQWLLGKRRLPPGIRSASGIVLDIGASDRWVVPHLAAGAYYLTLDYPATNHEFYNSKPDIFGDASRLPIGDATIDNIICLQVIEHLSNPAGALREMARVLKPNGHAWLSIPFTYPIHNEPYDFQRYTEFGLRREAVNADLEWVSLERSHHAVTASAFVLCLSIAGGVDSKRGSNKLLLLPFALAAITIINVSAWIASSLWPDWKNMTLDYLLVLRKPGNSNHAAAP